MVDSEYITENYNFSKINIEAIIKNPDMSKCVPDHLKTKKNV